MLLQVLDLLECPVCQQAKRLWEMKGDITDKRIANGTVSCPEGHEWNVSEEILRFDEQASDEPMQYFERPKTGFPSEVKEQERLEFLPALQDFIENLHFPEDQIVKVSGNTILFMKYLKNEESKFVITHPEEGILRQLQEISARKRIYDNMAFIRTDDVNMIGPINQIEMFPNKIDEDMENTLFIGFVEKGREIWSGTNVTLRAYLSS